MSARTHRRRFLQSASALGLGAGLVGSGLRVVTPARAEDLKVGPDAVRFRPEIEPVVRWIEETPRARIFDVALEQLKDGLSYQDLMAGVFLAAIRNVQPRPVGFKFHAVLVVNSAHLLAISAAEDDRLLPLLWALDNFKNSQMQDVKEGDWTLSRVDEAHVPGPGEAKKRFVEAMDAWDVDGADVATAALCRSGGAGEVMEAFWRYGVRDQRDIGHKAIFASQCWRTLQTIGWQHAEPVLRSLAYGLLDPGGDKKPEPVGPYHSNLERAPKIRDGWTVGRLDAGATEEMLRTLREASPDDASSKAVELLNAGISPHSLWDSVVLGASELMMRSPGIIALHSMTASNALHYTFKFSGDDTTRRMALLQATGWIPLYRQRAQNGHDVRIDDLEPKSPDSKDGEAVGEIFADLGKNRVDAARKVVGYIDKGGSPDEVFAGMRSLVLHKGRDSHQYKYGAASWEECLLSSDDRWKGPLAASTLLYVPGSDAPDSPLMNRAKDAVKRVLEARTTG